MKNGLLLRAFCYLRFGFPELNSGHLSYLSFKGWKEKATHTVGRIIFRF